MIDPGNASIFCTCYVNDQSMFGETYFEIYDGGQYIPEKFKLKTDSIEVIISYLVKHGINNKSDNYNSKSNSNI